LNDKIFAATLAISLIALAVAANANSVTAYAPQSGDFFNYSETTTVNNGQNSYSGYADQTQTTGMEKMNTISQSNVSATYSYSFKYSNSQGLSNSSSSSGNYTWSTSSFTYVKGTDHQVGYTKPIYVWFDMNPSLPAGGTFYVLNTQFTVLSKNYSLQLPTEGNKYVQSIQTKGTGQYQRNDSYGLFTASYTWYEYFDPSTGYIIGYNYVEQDNGSYLGQAGSFTYTDNLYVTSTSYNLATANPPPVNPIDTLLALAPYLFLALIVVVFAVVVVVYASKRRRRMDTIPEHPLGPATLPNAPPSTALESGIDLGSKPPPQVVIRDVAKVNCKYCGTLIPTTADTCPYCGGPRR
jgi:hypothetical protein